MESEIDARLAAIAEKGGVLRGKVLDLVLRLGRTDLVPEDPKTPLTDDTKTLLQAAFAEHGLRLQQSPLRRRATTWSSVAEVSRATPERPAMPRTKSRTPEADRLIAFVGATAVGYLAATFALPADASSLARIGVAFVTGFVVMSLVGGGEDEDDTVQPSANEGFTEAPQTKTCPDCAETVLAAAGVCKHCGYRFDAHASPQ